MSPLPRVTIGRQLIHVERVESTQNVAAELAGDPTRHGLVVRADEQTAGRGRRGARWLAPPGGCLMFSALLFPPPELRRPAALTVLAGVSVCDAVATIAGRAPRLKWPNDVLLDDRKIGGILIETAGEAAIVGVGLNVNIPAAFFELARLDRAGSLLSLLGRPQLVEPLFQESLRTMNETYDALVRGDVRSVEERWRRCSGLVGQLVEVHTAAGVHQGRLRELSLQFVELETPSGQLLSFAPEAVQRLAPAEADGGADDAR